MVIIVNRFGDRYYCGDGKFRSFANFGTFSECVREYKTLRGAMIRANKLNSGLKSQLRLPYVLPMGFTIDAGGHVFDTDGNMKFHQIDLYDEAKRQFESRKK